MPQSITMRITMGFDIDTMREANPDLVFRNRGDRIRVSERQKKRKRAKLADHERRELIRHGRKLARQSRA